MKLLFLYRFPLATISIVWLFVVLLIWPTGNFPLNDDWAYTKSVQWLAEDGELKTVDWPAMNLLGQTLIGTLWCKIVGFSFFKLRILTILISLLTLIYTHKLFITLFKHSTIAMLGTITIMVNPLFINMSFSFMTEVYFLWPIVMALYFLIRYFQDDTKISRLFLFFIFTCLAITVRQTGILLLLSGVLVGLWFTRGSLIKQGFLVLLCIIGLVFYFYLQSFIMHQFNKNPSYMGSGSVLNEVLQRNLSAQMFYRTGTILLLAGLFLLPLTWPLFMENSKILSKKQQFLRMAIMIPFVIPMIREFTFFPHGNVFYAFGLGPLTLKDQLLLNQSPNQQGVLLLLLQIISFSGGLLLIHGLIHVCLTQLSKNSTFFFPVLTGAVFILMLCASFFLPTFFFDRYMLILFIPASILLAAALYKFPVFKLNFSYLCIGVFFIFGILASKTYFAWNNARWNALTDLIDNKAVSPKEIDGGFEFNGWYQTAKVNQHPEKSWWFVEDDKYVVCFSPIAGYKIIREFSYVDYLTLSKKTIFVLERFSKPLQTEGPH